MNTNIHRLRATMESAVHSGQVAQITKTLGITHKYDEGQLAQRLTAGALVMSSLKKFYEGYFGARRFRAAMEEGRKLRTSSPAAYADFMRAHESQLSDLRPIRAERAILEALTTSDLAYALATLRDSTRIDNTPVFETALTDLAGILETVQDFGEIRTRNPIQLGDRFLKRRPEGTNLQYTSWTAATGSFTVVNNELGVSITWEALLNDRLREFQDALYELGQAAARSRALALLDAIRRGATRVTLPNGSKGPNIDNLEAMQAFLSDQTYQGSPVSRTITDIFVPNAWKILAAQSIRAETVGYTGGASGALATTNPTNPVYQLGDVHGEPIMTEAPIDPDWTGANVKDWIVADRTGNPLQHAVLAGFEGGARTLTRIAETVELDLGSFENHIFEVKISDVYGAAVRNPTAIAIASGTDN